MLRSQTTRRSFSQPQLTYSFATSQREIEDAQRLRHMVFSEEMGARLKSGGEGIDRDLFDAFCDHLVVREADSNEVVGTYRVLNGQQAKKVGGFYSDQEFDLVRLSHLRESLVELGRACVHPNYRNGAVIALLWRGLARYVHARQCEYLIGCASISMKDGGRAAASVYRRLAQHHLSPVEYRVFPRYPLLLTDLGDDVAATIPPLIQVYIKLGAYICGEPAWDPDFNTADILIILPISRLTARYVRHFMK